MKVIAIEEHFVTDQVARLGGTVEARWRDDSSSFLPPGGDMERRLHDLADERIRLMDESGVDVQILSLTTPGVQNLSPSEARDTASRINDVIAAAVTGRPDRFGAVRHAAHRQTAPRPRGSWSVP